MSLTEMHPPRGTPVGVVRFHSPPGSETDGVGEEGAGVAGGVVTVVFVLEDVGVGDVDDELLPHAHVSAAKAAIAIVPNRGCIQPPV